MADQTPPRTDPTPTDPAEEGGAWAAAQLLDLLVIRDPRVRPDAPVYTAAARAISVAPGLPRDVEQEQIMWVLLRDVLERNN